MKKSATMIGAFLLLIAFTAASVLGQPVRNGDDVVWARDVAGATMTLDGDFLEPEWTSAEVIPLVWNQPHGVPGDGQKIEGNPTLADPLDGNNGNLYILRDGNTLWLGLGVDDVSVGGGRGLNAGNWFFDGFIMAMQDRSRVNLINYDDANNFATRPAEFIYGWWHPADTLEGGLPVPGIAPRFFGDYGVGFGDSMNAERSAEKQAVLNWAYTIDQFGGRSNDDAQQGIGYRMEVTIDLGLMGYDFSAPGGDKVPFGFALQDADYNWPFNDSQFFVSRVWFQNQWANNFNEGVAYFYGDPSVTVNSGPAPDVTTPELTIPSRGSFLAPDIDGALSEGVWDALEPAIYLQYKATPETMAMNKATVMKYYHRWFRPDINGDGNAAIVVDPSLATAKFFFDGDILYIGVDVADQAISGLSAENGRDGIRFTMRQVDSLETDHTMFSRQFDVYIDSSGTLQYALDAQTVRQVDPTAFEAAVGLKGASTAADPTDVDEGYQIEIAIDLTKSLGYPPGLGDGRLWLSANFFDGDFLEAMGDSYAMRTWSPGERNQEAVVYAYLNSATGVAVEESETLPERITLFRNYPNPFNPSTTMRFAIPESGEVALQVFDILGRQVATLNLGTQPAGSHEYVFRPDGLASGLYLYRVQVGDANSGRVQVSDVGRMILLK